MSATTKLTLYSRPFYNILRNKKTLEGRVAKGYYNKVDRGDMFLFKNIENKEEKRELKVKVVSIHKFSSFEEAFSVLDSNKAIPNYTLKDTINIYYKYYPKKEIIKFGVIFFEIKLINVLYNFARLNHK